MLDIDTLSIATLTRYDELDETDGWGEPVPAGVRIRHPCARYTFRVGDDGHGLVCVRVGAALASGTGSSVFLAELVGTDDFPEAAENMPHVANEAEPPAGPATSLAASAPLCVRVGGSRGLASWRLAQRIPAHPNVLRPLAFGDDGRSMLMPRYPCDLFEAMWGDEDGPGGPRPRFEPLSMAVDVLDAVLHLHDNGVAHRDIKPENVLVTADGRGVLADLEFCTRAAWLPLAKYAGTSRYTPPEILDGEAGPLQPESGAPNCFSPFAVDRYATAVTVLDILVRDVVWTNATFDGVRSEDLDRPLRQVEDMYSARLRLALQRLFRSLSAPSMDELLDVLVFEDQVQRGRGGHRGK
jgi:serine/threonine protein kinase